MLRRHVVIVLVDRLDMATARALQYARTLTPTSSGPSTSPSTPGRPAELEAEWGRLGLTRLPLDVIECEDRRLTRAALELAAEAVADGETECTILLPRRGFAAGCGTACSTTAPPTRSPPCCRQLAHVNATVVPYHLPGQFGDRVRSYGQAVQKSRPQRQGRYVGRQRNGRGRRRPG